MQSVYNRKKVDQFSYHTDSFIPTMYVWKEKGWNEYLVPRLKYVVVWDRHSSTQHTTCPKDDVRLHFSVSYSHDVRISL